MTLVDDPNSPKVTDVIICGGGPVGLAAALLLGRAGVSVNLFEKRACTTHLPKGQYLHAATGELFRQWGVWELLAESGWETSKSNGQGFFVTIADGPLTGIRHTERPHREYVEKWERISPVYPRKVPASAYESALRIKAEEHPCVWTTFNARVMDVAEEAEKVCVTVEEADSNRRKTYCARYLLACDGAHSFIRTRIGRGQDHGPTFGNQVLIEFRADLDETLGRHGFFHNFILHPKYAGWFGSKHPTTGVWRYSFTHDDEDNLPPEEVILERIRGGLGMPDLPIEISEIFRFDYSTGLLRNWREGNVLFLGDSAHWHSPWGGLGMNSGIQDANNLAWKLKLVLENAACNSLLDTYETERKSRARITVKTATYNSLHYQAIARSVRVGEESLFDHGRLSPEANVLLEQWSDRHGDSALLHTGYQLGTTYVSDAIIPTDEPFPPYRPNTYVETVIPGVRAPHAWLVDPHGRRVSTIDLWGRGFVLIGYHGNDHWRRASTEVSRLFGVDIRFIRVAHEGGDYRPQDDKFVTLYGQGVGSVVLVRPDGFIATRFDTLSSQVPEDRLAGALNRLLFRERQPIETRAFRRRTPAISNV